MAELLPCPFCGGEARVSFVTDNVLHVYARYRGRFVFAGCPRCGITTGIYNAHNKTRSPLINDSNTKRAYQKAIAAWNKRTPKERSE